MYIVSTYLKMYICDQKCVSKMDLVFNAVIEREHVVLHIAEVLLPLEEVFLPVDPSVQRLYALLHLRIAGRARGETVEKSKAPVG